MESITLYARCIKVVQLENLSFTQLQEEAVLPLHPQHHSLRAIKFQVPRLALEVPQSMSCWMLEEQ